MSQAASQATPALNKLQTFGIVVAVIGLGVLLGSFATHGGAEQFFRSYLIGFVYVASFPLGCLAILFIQYLSGGQWGLIIRRILEAGAKTMPLLLILFLPMLAGMTHIFAWAVPGATTNDVVLQRKAPYLNVSFFSGRAFLYLVLWIGFAFAINRFARRQDEYKDMRIKKFIHDFSGVGLVMLSITMTFAATDWIMSVDPHWYSTMLPVIWMAGSLLTGFTTSVVVVTMLLGTEPFSKVVKKRHVHDLGNFMLAFTMFWAYCSFSQFLITWSGNLREEIPWYLHRMHGGWGLIAGGLIVLHFFLPFFMLLMKDIKKYANRLIVVAMLLLVMRLVDVTWLISPSYGGHGHEWHLNPFDFAAGIGFAGVWMVYFIWNLKQTPLLPEYDPNLEALHHAQH